MASALHAADVVTLVMAELFDALNALIAAVTADVWEDVVCEFCALLCAANIVLALGPAVTAATVLTPATAGSCVIAGSSVVSSGGRACCNSCI